VISAREAAEKIVEHVLDQVQIHGNFEGSARRGDRHLVLHSLLDRETGEIRPFKDQLVSVVTKYLEQELNP
jgi:hypothetical protein